MWKHKGEGVPRCMCKPVYVEACEDVGLSCVYPQICVWTRMYPTARADMGSQVWCVFTAVSAGMCTFRLEWKGTAV